MTDIHSDRFEVAPGAPLQASVHSVPPPPPPPPPPGPPPSRSRGRTLAAAAAVVAALGAGAAVGVPVGLLSRGGTPSPTSSASPSPSGASAAVVQARALYQQVVTAANGSSGFHYVADSTGGTGTQRIVGDAGQDGGTQAITMASTYGLEQFSLVLVDRIVYFQGNSPALQDQLGVPAANAPALVGRWISVSSADGPYAIVAPGITVADQVQENGLVPTSITQDSTGTRITGTVPPQQGGTGPAHLDIDSGSHLPIAYVAVVTASGTTTTTTIRFTKWGMATSVAAPSGAVDWSTLGASEPPGGYGSGGSSAQTPQA